MKSETQIREKFERQRLLFRMWNEEDGELVRTEPDSVERDRIRKKLATQIELLSWVLAE